MGGERKDDKVLLKTVLKLFSACTIRGILIRFTRLDFEEIHYKWCNFIYSMNG